MLCFWQWVTLCGLIAARSTIHRPPLRGKLLILDIDQTIVQKKIIDGAVHWTLRPHLDTFCQRLSLHFTMVLYTAASQKHAKLAIEIITANTSCRFAAVYSRHHPSMLRAKLSIDGGPSDTLTIKSVDALLPYINTDLDTGYLLRDVVFIDDSWQHFHMERNGFNDRAIFDESAVQYEDRSYRTDWNQMVGIHIYPMYAGYDVETDTDLLQLVAPLTVIAQEQCSTTALFFGVPWERLAQLADFDSCPPLKRLMTKRKKEKYLLALDMDKTLVYRHGQRMVIRPHLRSFIHALAPLYDIVLFSGEPRNIVNGVLEGLKTYMTVDFDHVTDESHASVLNAAFRTNDGIVEHVQLKSVEKLVQQLQDEGHTSYSLHKTVMVDDEMLQFNPHVPELWGNVDAVEEHCYWNRRLGVHIVPMPVHDGNLDQYVEQRGDDDLKPLIKPLQYIAVARIDTLGQLNGGRIPAYARELLSSRGTERI